MTAPAKVPAGTWIDVSHHQEDRSPRVDVDLAAYKAAGGVRVGLKATQGTTYTDPYFTRWYTWAHDLELATVPYHFAENEDSPAGDFAHFKRTVTAAGGLRAGVAPDGWPWDYPSLDNEDVPDQARAEGFTRGWGTAALDAGWWYGNLYTGVWYGRPAQLTPDDLPAGWQWLWLSDYTSAPDSAITLPPGWGRAQLFARQYTSQASVPGIAGPVDASRTLGTWYGTEDPDVSYNDAVRALRDVLHLPAPDPTSDDPARRLGGLAIPRGQPDNLNFARITVGGVQTEALEDRAEAGRDAAQLAALQALADRLDPARLAEQIVLRLPQLTVEQAAVEAAIRHVLGGLDNPPAPTGPVA